MQSLLIIDDDMTFGSRLALSFHRRGYDAKACRDGASAIALMKQCDDGFDGAIVDLRLEGESGLDVVARLRKLAPELKIVVITGYGSIATAKEALRHGAVDYLAKPTDAVEIEQVLFGPKTSAKLASPHPTANVPSLQRVEWEHLQRVLADTNGNISEAARRLGIERRTLQRKLAKYPPAE